MSSNQYPIHALKGIKKSFDNAAQAKIEQYMALPVFNMQTTTEWDEIYTSTEGFSVMKELAETETPSIGKESEGYKIVITPKRYGGAIVITEEDQRRKLDSTVKIDEFLMRQKDDLIKDGIDFFIKDCHKFLNEAFDSTSDLLAPDGAAICGDHTWKNGNTFTNRVTDAFGEAAMDDANEYAGDFKAADGKSRTLNWKYLIVKKGSANHREAKRLFAMDAIRPTTYNDINIYEGELDIVVTPYILPANKNNWLLMDTTEQESPFYVGINKMLSLNEPQVQSDESVRSNVTGFWKSGVINMPYTVYGGEVAA